MTQSGDFLVDQIDRAMMQYYEEGVGAYTFTLTCAPDVIVDLHDEIRPQSQAAEVGVASVSMRFGTLHVEVDETYSPGFWTIAPRSETV